ncbi:MAG TPA: hypothetical protein VHE54_15280 [Puia sp.]|nr:hypothetical protein [Puia sp.]
MTKDNYHAFHRAMMTGLFIGIIDTLICLAYNIGFRNYTGYIPSALINVSSLIFMVNLTMTVVGILFYVFHRNLKQGDTVFFVFFLALTAFLAWKITGIHRFDDSHDNSSFKGLLGGIVVIMGLSGACLPFLFRSRKFVDAII